ncbi:uncharacterized protein LOC126842352 isoform X1 [Adelges cooleyi]|uniref:uncharacterized protein LOC126842352 isoform X1 n=1 Tax=Adelges cooleyi TaxID=133065 RepID=UPI0021805B10|nr:uncharacterized protein LOC126842352 isoform X1 [Adelges cooleyi]XP_050435243.1 uncharacterized protein LOC126842352 isoform X1 [Adelges cooleyi]
MEIQADRWHGLLDNSKSNVSLAHDNILTKGRCSSVIREYWTHWITLSVLMFAMYFVICMYLEWSYYVKRRENSADWKCQPTKWPKRSARLNEIKHSLTALTTITATVSVYSTYIACGGHSSLYLDFDAYPRTWWIVQWPLIHITTDYSIYWLHRMFHTRFLYKHVHAYHHRYNQPNPWNAFAVHPIEIITNALAEIALLFVVPIHWLPYAAVLGYSAYQNIIQHSGIDFKPSWWEIGKPDVMFHDYHHLNSRVNFGSTCYVWDQIHGTMSKSNNQSSKKSKDPSVVDPSSVNK